MAGFFEIFNFARNVCLNLNSIRLTCERADLMANLEI